MSEQQHEQEQQQPSTVTVRFGVEVEFDKANGDLTVTVAAPTGMFNRDEAERISRFVGKIILAAADRRYNERVAA